MPSINDTRIEFGTQSQCVTRKDQIPTRCNSLVLYPDPNRAIKQTIQKLNLQKMVQRSTVKNIPTKANLINKTNPVHRFVMTLTHSDKLIVCNLLPLIPDLSSNPRNQRLTKFKNTPREQVENPKVYHDFDWHLNEEAYSTLKGRGGGCL